MKKQPILIGMATGDITPKMPNLLRGQTYIRVMEGVHDPLQANVMAIGQKKEDAVFWVSLDLTQFPEELVRCIAAGIAEKIPGFTRDRLICSAIHTHTAPFVSSAGASEMWGEAYRIYHLPEGVQRPEDYRDKTLVPAVAEACKQAWDNMAPSGVSPVLGHAVIGHCRRVVYRDGTSKMYGSTNTYNFERLEGPSDDSVEWIYIYDEAKKLKGLFVNVCCPAQVVENKLVASADYVGAFRKRLFEHLGYAVPVVTVIGAAGDIAPRDLVRSRGAKDPLNPNRSNPDPKCRAWNRGEANMRDFDGADELGRRLLWAFLYDREKADAMIQTEVEFQHGFEYLPVKIRTVSEAEYQEAKAVYQPMVEKYNGDFSAFSQEDRRAVSLQAGICRRYERQKRSTFYDMPFHTLRLGPCGFVTCPSEVFLEYGLRIRARANCEHLIFSQLTDDENEYIPTPFAVAAKSYSAMVSNQLVSCEGAEYFVETAIRRVNDYFKTEE